jgi:hypothetical protein
MWGFPMYACSAAALLAECSAQLSRYSTSQRQGKLGYGRRVEELVVQAPDAHSEAVWLASLSPLKEEVFSVLRSVLFSHGTGLCVPAAL